MEQIIMLLPGKWIQTTERDVPIEVLDTYGRSLLVKIKTDDIPKIQEMALADQNYYGEQRRKYHSLESCASRVVTKLAGALR